jgi:hypothetical protein
VTGRPEVLSILSEAERSALCKFEPLLEEKSLSVRVAQVSSGEINHVQIPATFIESFPLPCLPHPPPPPLSSLSATEEKQCQMLLANFRSSSRRTNRGTKYRCVFTRSRPAPARKRPAFLEQLSAMAFIFPRETDRAPCLSTRHGSATCALNVEARYVYVCIHNRIAADRFARVPIADCQR